MDVSFKPTQSITEVMDESRRRFKESYGRLLTEEEAIQLTDELRKEIREGKKENEN